jgi:hypothetical protein
MASITHNEALAYLATGTLPADFKERCEVHAEFEPLPGDPYRNQWLIGRDQAAVFLFDGSLPVDFRTRVERFVEDAPCSNCDDVRCMHFVLRDWWSDDIDRCDGWCCPFCSDMKDLVQAKGTAAAKAATPLLAGHPAG